jgi:RHS repeat-associated protein
VYSHSTPTATRLRAWWGGVSFTLTYDADNRLVGISSTGMTASYTYDGDGNRIKNVVNGIITVYIGNYYEVTDPGASQTVKKYYYAGGARVAMSDNGVVRYFVTDHLGSTTKLINTDGSEYSEVDYFSWGSDSPIPTNIGTSFKYTGQRQAEAGLYFYNARWYDPQVGRFIQADTIIPEPGNPLAWDRYAYVKNNPINNNDPSGHKPCENGKCENTKKTSTTQQLKWTYVKGFSEADFSNTHEYQGNTNDCGSFSLAAAGKLIGSQNDSGATLDSLLVKGGYKSDDMGILPYFLYLAASVYLQNNQVSYQQNGTIDQLRQNVDSGSISIVGVSWQTTDTILKLAIFVNPANDPGRGVTVGHWMVVAGYNDQE